MSRLQGKIAVVTGANSGIGFASAKRFAQEGARVFITGRRQAELDQARSEIGPLATSIQADVTHMDDLDRIVETVKGAAGRIDVLMLNAAFAEFVPIGEITQEHYDITFDTNVRGPVFLMQKALPILSDNASVVITGSVAATVGFGNMSIYAATKGALRAMARSWMVDLKDRGIRVNLLAPGNIKTPALDRLVPPEHQQAAFLGGILPMRLGQPDEMANVALFLASDESAFVNGAELLADGGLVQI